MKKRAFTLALVLTLAISVVLSGCGSSSSGSSSSGSSSGSSASGSSASGGDVLIISDDSWEGIDMFQVSSWNDMQALVNAQILETDPETLAPTPGICSASVWSEDGLTWTLTFPEGMYYSTGEQLEPEDFVASIEWGREVSEYADGYESIESMEIDGRDVIMHLSEFQADMEYNFQSCFIGIIDKDELESMSKDELLWGCHPYGPYYVTDFEPGAYVELKANPGYVTYNPNIDNKGACPVENVRVVFGGENFTQSQGVQNGDYDVLATLPMAYFDELEASDAVTVTEASGAQLYYAEFNITDPILSDYDVRKAIIRAFSRDNLSAYLEDDMSPAYSLILSKCLNYDESAEEYYNENYGYDPAAARELLAGAGWEDTDGDGIVDKDGTPLSFVFDCRDTESAKKVAQSLQLDLLEVGIDMQITTQDWSYVNQDVEDGNFQFAYLGLGWSEPFLLMDRFCQRNPECTNPDPEGQEALVAAARKIIDYDERTDAITELQLKIMDYCSLVPFLDETSFRCWRSEIQGIKCSTTGGFFINDIVVDENGNFRNVQ